MSTSPPDANKTLAQGSTGPVCARTLVGRIGVFPWSKKIFYFFVSAKVTVLVLLLWLRNTLFFHTPKKQCGFGAQMR
jgi:hypothetical protein